MALKTSNLNISFLPLFFFLLRLLVRVAATAKRQKAGSLPIIRNKKGMTYSASPH